MAVNNMELTQLSTVLASIVGQATGQAVLTPTDLSSFISVAQTGLKTGYDPLTTAISQVLSKTIFSVRPYTAKFRGLQADEVRYGNHVRKLTTIDKPFEDDDRIKLVDGQSIDQQKVNKPSVLQTNFYGANVYQKSLTIYRDQLDVAFSGPEEFGRFISMIMQNASDMIEQAHEETARMTIANLIAGINYQEAQNITSGRVIHLISEYNAETGSSLTNTSVYAPANFEAFAKWLFGYLKTLSDRLAERSAKYHQNFTGKTIMRHTPLERQKCYLYSPVLNKVDANVLSSVFHDEYLRIMDHEDVTYFQSIDTPDAIKVTPSVTAADGTIATATAQDMSKVFGVIFDEDAAGYTVVNQWSASAPFNARGGYTNIFWHFTDRYWNDFTENAIVLLLDVAGSKTVAKS